MHNIFSSHLDFLELTQLFKFYAKLSKKMQYTLHIRMSCKMFNVLVLYSVHYFSSMGQFFNSNLLTGAPKDYIYSNSLDKNSCYDFFKKF